MSLIKHSASNFRLPSLMPRSLMLAASVTASALSGAAFAGEPEAKDIFVAKVMRVQSTPVSSHGQAVPAAERLDHESAQDRFVDQVLMGRPSGTTDVAVSAVTDDRPSWPDVGFLRPIPPR